ncbi:hypothetical protein [Nonomuraea salmonea]|uniref:hypothetical protein n=1 Tax=Nonomuraea salmonea TaxID=46181 RepID=UPI002FEB0058
MTLDIADLKVRIGGKDVLRGVDLRLAAGKVHGLAGESGSGKTMTGLAVLGLLPHGAKASGGPSRSASATCCGCRPRS